MSLSKKEIDELQPIIQDTVSKRLGFPEKAVMKAALSCLTDNLDHEDATEKMSSLLGDDLAPRFVEDLLDNVRKFRKSKLASRKRSNTDNDESPLKKAKLNRLNALIDDEPLPPTIPEADPEALLANANNITEMVANMKKQIEQRKKMLIQSGVAPALIEHQERMDKRIKEEQAKAKLLADADDKAKRAAELQARIQAKTGKLFGINLPIKSAAELNAIPITEMTKPAAVVLDAEGNAIDQATGRYLQISQRLPTLKVNIREKKRELLKVDVEQPQQEEEEVKHFDPRVGMNPSQRGRRSTFTFHQRGKFQQLAQRMRAKAQMEKLQKQIQAVAKKTGISSAAKLAQVVKKEDLDLRYIPDIEWWDMAVLPNRTYKDLTRELKKDEELFVGITNLVEHPIGKHAPSEPKSTPAMPIFLTKKERKKIRTQRRREHEKEKQEKIRLGLEPPPAPKVKISNLMRVLASEAVQDPTKVEAHVRTQMAARQKKHEAANEERKLSKEERSNKKINKLKEDTSLGVHTAVYQLLDLSNPAKKFKVDTNAQQLYMTGTVIIMKEFVLVLVEGGPKAQKKFKRLMLNRIKWDEDSAQGHRQDKLDKKNNEVDANRKKNSCRLIWEGTNVERNFKDWKFHMFKNEQEVQVFLKSHNVEHYWNLAHSQSVLEETDT
ncbi:U4/U6 small nuclear ribonucleoprotein Prp3-like [Hydractinia symbiolongicarpus]|uniref:U4/U6 small nuclear ribonucleoprotein Prp3-like n=1 Tax=Hydractinia symbiolongicarpus TaxID=13093 RepID=UPI00255081C9|nr:U4/U6 small nuclear ribonucleoprotein Prp3-like [Hydractinia symbiolongicarpus]